MRLNEVYRNSGLGKWFHGESATKEPGWDRYNSEGKRVGKCGDAKEGSAYSACLSKQKADKLGKEGRASFVNRKRAAQNKAGRGEKGTGRKGKKPINVDTGASKMEECYECEQEIILEGKNKPNDPEKWSACKSAAKSKFDVYPSAYANAWAAKCYKKKGGTWRSLKEETANVKEITRENILFNFMENAKPEFARRGAEKQRPKSWNKGTKSGSEKKKMRRQGKEETRQMDEGVSVYNPQQTQIEKPETPKQSQHAPKKETSTEEKLTGIPNAVGHHSTQLKVFKSLLPKPQPTNTETIKHEMGGDVAMNTQNTPRFGAAEKDLDFSSRLLDQDRLIANLRYKLSDLQASTNAKRIEDEIKKKKKNEGPTLYDDH